MEALGNTFVVLVGPYDPDAKEVVELCGQYGEKPADGLLVATAIDSHAVRMQYWNNDGSPAEMCGNGLRCLAKFSQTKGLVDVSSFTVLTDVGPLKVVCKDEPDMVEVQVGKVTVTEDPIDLYDVLFFEANVGNPHAVTFVDDSNVAPVRTLGPKVEIESHFPNKTNVEFAQIVAPNRIKLRIWERGVGETLACGTGMAATSAVFAEHKNGEYPVTVEVLGGEAELWIDEEGYTRMLGPARFS